MEKTYYVYLVSPYGNECIGRGTLEECEKIKARKDSEWKIGYMWDVHISDHQEKEYLMYD